MILKAQTQHLLVSCLILTAFAAAGFSAYTILVSPYSVPTSEGYGSVLSNSNQASALKSITVLSLADKEKTATSTLESVQGVGVGQNGTKKDGVSLCADFPKTISSYELQSTKISNSPSEIGHGTYLDTKTRKLITINPDEKISLVYETTKDSIKPNAKSKIKPVSSRVNVNVFRYNAFADLQKDFAGAFGLTSAHTEAKSIIATKAEVKSNPGLKNRVQYIYKNENTLIEATGVNETDARRVAEQISGSCDSKPVFKSDTPRGFVSWRTTDLSKVDRTSYVTIADADITLNLELARFGSDILITDQTDSDNLGLGGLLPQSKYRVFAIPTVDQKGKIRPMQDVHLFAIKSTDIHLFLNALHNRQVEVLGNTAVSTERSSYHGLHVSAGKNIYTYEKVTEDGALISTVEHVYTVTRRGTAFVFVYDYADIETVESIVDNLK